MESSEEGSRTGNRRIQMCTFIKKWNAAAKSMNLVKCQCGVQCYYFTSMTDANPSRRFIRCGNYKASLSLMVFAYSSELPVNKGQDLEFVEHNDLVLCDVR